MGSCIQCSVKTCKTAYHVTCAFRHNLEMRAIIEDENAEDGVKLRVSRALFKFSILFIRIWNVNISWYRVQIWRTGRNSWQIL
jgi:hypothetical protein